MKDVFERYLLSLRQDRDDKTELSDRGALETLLNAAAQKADSGIHVIHEAKKVRGSGPDFKVMKSAMILGYVEDKTVGENLDQVRRSDQMKRYMALSNNILLTDYLEFIWLKDGKVNGRERIAFRDDLEGRPKKPREDRVKAVSDLLRGFFSTAPEGIGRAQQLALALAIRSHFLRDFLDSELRRQANEDTKGRLWGLYQIFRDQVFHELTLGEFADAFAQMLAYGLFLARLNSDSKTITLHNAREYVPGSFRLIRELVDFLTELEKDEYRDVRWVVEEVLSIVNGLKLREIHEDLSFRQRKAISRKVRAADEEEHRLFERDPFIYFYEDYLKAYDKATRKGRGVYYTPPPIVNFIVRAIDDILKESFGIPDGLADNRRVTVLDFACGTGTFILEVLERIFENIGGVGSAKASLVVRDHMLKNVFGFEYLIAPYTIARLKLSQYLKDKGHPLNGNERLQVFLTNTLEPIVTESDQRELWPVPALASEIKEAQAVKEKPILVITGNPPYAGHSKNKGVWISTAINEYKFVHVTDAEGREQRKPLGERNPKWLNDDYVKFIRFAQMKMDAVAEGVVGVITNHSWLDNPTFRGMRQSLMRSFEQIYVLDLHGNAKKKERSPDGSDDQNVFDIEQGVAISLLVKKKNVERGVWRADWWGKRIAKYQGGAEQTIASVEWQKLEPRAPDFLMLMQDYDEKSRYGTGWKVTDIFPANSVGIVTARDNLCIHFDEAELMRTVRDFAALDPEAARQKYQLGKDVDDWKAEWAQADVKDHGANERYATKILYRPGDDRWTYFTGRSRGFICRPRQDVMRHMMRENVAIITTRLTKDDWSALVTDTLAAHKSGSRYDITYIFPLYLYPPEPGQRRTKSDLPGDNDSFAGESCIESFARAFRNWLDEKYGPHFSPEEIFGHIYAILHAPTYRTRYAEFLRIDFPRVPFPESADDFETLSGLGWALVQAHLLRELPRQKLAAYHGKGDHTVEAVRYTPEEQAVAINKTQFFKPVPQAVWDFHIGGYQVLDKYLKSRKGRVLSLDEINHVSAIADSLAFTIEQMARIDAAYRAAFPDRG